MCGPVQGTLVRLQKGSFVSIVEDLTSKYLFVFDEFKILNL